MLEVNPNDTVGGFVEPGGVRFGFAVDVEAEVFEEFLETPKGVLGQVVGGFDGFLGKLALFAGRFGQGRFKRVWIDVLARGLELKGEFDEIGSFLCGLIKSRKALNDALIGTYREGLGAFGFGGLVVED